MRRLIYCVIAMVWLVAGAGMALAAQKRVALVIGNANYSIKPLANPANDATAIAAAFEVLGFDHVTLKTNLTRRQMIDALQAFERQAGGADVSVVFFAGHGTALDQTDTYLVPIDAKLEREADLEDEAISLKSVLRRLEGTQGLRLIILDACRNPPFQLAGRKRSTARGLSRIEPDDNTLVAYATKDGATADDGAGPHSPFTTALLNRLASPGLDVSFVFRHVRDDVMAATGRQQQPHLYGTLGATPVYLNAGLNPAGLAPPAPLPTVVTPPPTPAPKVTAPSEEAPAVLVGEPLIRKVQSELARLGCDPGNIDGKWGAKARGALAQFAKLTKVSLDPDQPDATMLATLAQRTARVCPLVCDPDEFERNGKCVTKPVVAQPEPAPKPAAPKAASARVDVRPAPSPRKEEPSSRNESKEELCTRIGAGSRYEGMVPCSSPYARRP
jgi:Caspase domain